jgi:hypothetical protein
MGEPQLDGGSEMRTERRKHPRKKPEVLVYLDLGPSNGGMVRDVSEGGIGFRAVSPMCAGQRSAFAFAFDGATRLEGECDLVWIDEGGRVGGLRFTEVSAELREAVRKHVAGASNRGEQLVEVPVTAGEPVVRQGDPADRFYIIESGSFTVTQAGPSGEPVVLRQLGPDAVFGELGLLNQTPRTATVTASTDGLLLALERDDFLALVGVGGPLRGRLLGLYSGASGTR